MTRRTAELSEIHWQALKLLEERNLSRKEIATQCGWKIDYFNELCAGDVERAGHVAELFKIEFKKIEKKHDDFHKALVKSNSIASQELIRDVLAKLKSRKFLTLDEKKLLATINNSLAKSTPSVSVSNLSFSYTKGLNPEELIYEFQRLRRIAEGSFDRRGVQEALSGGSGELPAVDE